MKILLFSLFSFSIMSPLTVILASTMESGVGFTELPDLHYSQSDKSSWKMYKVDDCLMANIYDEQEMKAREIGFRRCRDGSISFVQPPARGVGGWEGKCGQTFGANTLYSLCQKKVDPAQYFQSVFRDITPGVRPGILRRGMQKIFDSLGHDCPTDLGLWSYQTAKSDKNFISRIKTLNQPKFSHPNMISINRSGETVFRNPVGVLVQNPGGSYLHWVTIIDTLSGQDQDSCEMIVNHWDNQYQVPCSVIANWSYRVGRTYPIILKSYSIVSFK